MKENLKVSQISKNVQITTKELINEFYHSTTKTQMEYKQQLQQLCGLAWSMDVCATIKQYQSNNSESTL